jgi:hypothetical protein
VPAYDPRQAARPTVANGDHSTGGGFIERMTRCILLVDIVCVFFAKSPNVAVFRFCEIFLLFCASAIVVCTLFSVYTVLGQENAVSVIERSLKTDKKHHAWIFSGPRGTGKFTTATQFANIVLQNQNNSGTHPDLHVIKKEDVVWSQNPSLQKRKQTNIPIDLLRERIIGGKTSDDRVHDAVAFKTPVSGKEKVFIIDEAELLDEQGQNALLKTLEEPPKNTTIILVTCRDDLLLQTIRSRCCPVYFSPLSTTAMQKWSENSGLDVSPSDLSWAIKFSNGSPGLVCEAVNANLPQLAGEISGFLNKNNNYDYSPVVLSVANFVDTVVSKKLKQNPSASKESANRRAVEMVLLMFGNASQERIRNNPSGSGIALASIIVDIERQLSTNISIKVLLESLCARWAHLCGGESVFI